MSSAARSMNRAAARAQAKEATKMLKQVLGSAKETEARFCRSLTMMPFWARVVIAFRIVFKRFR